MITNVTGRLPPEIIQHNVRLTYGRFRACYEDGLRRDRKLEGNVTVRFIIEADGRVGKVSLASSTLPDPVVVSCILDWYKTIPFPPPEGGIVQVVYPIMFSPGD